MKSRSIANEDELLDQLAQGDKMAYTVLYTTYAPAIYRVAVRFLQSEAQAKDVLQEIFLWVWENRQKVKGITNFSSYLATITKNQCLSHLKKGKWLEELPSDIANKPEDEHDWLGEEYMTRLELEIDQLPRQQQLVLKMGKLEGLKHSTIAQILNLSPSTVNNHMTTAISSLKQRLQKTILSLITLFGLWL